jgi:hypothetical protein
MLWALIVFAASVQLLAFENARPYYLQALLDLRSARWNIEHCSANANADDARAKAVAEINKVRMDLSHEYDDSSTHGLRKNSFKHLCKAVRYIGISLIATSRHGRH